MENKKINFHIYRYHLLPLTRRDNQIELFPEKKLTYEEIKAKKNDFFKDVLGDLNESKLNSNPLKLHHQEDTFYLFKLAQKKTTSITRNFETENIINEPYIYVVINNDSEVQKIAISENSDAFSNPDVVKNILNKVFQNDLKKFGLNIEIEQVFDKVNFWNYVGKHKYEITYLDFQFIKPNLANISRSLPEDFKNFADNVNSHKSQIILKAPEKGTLENIDKSNNEINGLVNYTSEGAGFIKMKIKNIRKTINTKESPVTLQIEELDIEGAGDQVLKLYKTIVSDEDN